MHLDHIVGMTIGQDKVRISVVIVIKEFETPSTEWTSCRSDFPSLIGPATRPLSGWGLKFFDYDNDGDADLILANGHPDDMVEMHNTQTTYKEPLMMSENVNGAFRNVSAESGPVFAKRYPARGLAIGDFDNDGYLDVLVCN